MIHTTPSGRTCVSVMLMSCRTRTSTSCMLSLGVPSVPAPMGGGGEINRMGGGPARSHLACHPCLHTGEGGGEQPDWWGGPLLIGRATCFGGQVLHTAQGCTGRQVLHAVTRCGPSSPLLASIHPTTTRHGPPPPPSPPPNTLPGTGLHRASWASPCATCSLARSRGRSSRAPRPRLSRKLQRKGGGGGQRAGEGQRKVL